MTELLRRVHEFRAACDGVRSRVGRLGLVPTMGALHAGHMALVADAARRSSAVAVTIFVNPTQFGKNEDFHRYPRDLERDLALCREAGVALVFAPEVAEMYPAGDRTRVRVDGLTEHLCGPFRPGHFEGVTTIVSKLFLATGPSVAVFGRKDYQQLKVIERMARDLLFPVEIVEHPTVRDSDGLALSSRNRHLEPADRERASSIPRALASAIAQHASGERAVAALRAPVERELVSAGMRVDYVTIADADELTPYGDEARIGARAVLAIAAHLGNTRLIDNVVFGEDGL